LEEFGIPYWSGWAAAIIADAHRLGDHLDRAAEYGRKALAITTRVNYRLGIGLAQRALGRAAYSDGRLDDADGSLVQALKIFDAMGAQFESARTRLDLAALARDRRDSADALSHVRHARHAFVSLGVTSYVDTTDALAREVTLPRR
jgi:hypothetical protein